MLFSLRGAAIRETFSPRSRASVARKLHLELLEPRELPASLVLPQTSVPTFTATFNMKVPGGGTVLVSGEPVSGGNFRGTLGGTRLTATYCLDTSLNLFPNSTYKNATSNRAGTVYGAAVPNAGAISWLLTHFGPSAKTAVEQDALQAAIWRTEYGDGFEIDGVDNDNGAPSFNQQIAATYKADLAALGSQTAPIDRVTWISPGANPDKTTGQGLAALAAAPHVTKTAVVSSANPSAAGKTVVFTAVVKDTSAQGASTPSGSVVFVIDGKVFGPAITLRSGRASIHTSKLSVKTHAIVAVYHPANSSFKGSTGKLSGGQKVHA